MRTNEIPVGTGRFRRDLERRPGARALYIPKVRKHADIVLQDGTRFTGYVFLEATARIQDMLNAENHFFPFLDETGGMVLVNKSAIAHLRPHDE